MSEQEDVVDIIFAIISDNPGIHFRAIVEECGKQIGVVDYHLNKLLKDHKIVSFKHRGHKLFFLHQWENRIIEYKHLIDTLRKTIPRSILLFLAQSKNNTNLSIKQIADQLKQTPSNLHWHIKRLIEDKLVVPVRKGREVTLQLNIKIPIINFLGKEIYPNRWDRLLDDIEMRFGR
ncbi:MAG: winged helix-turn-helix transcriptional regulator [Candidatus Kariarchaeaceae archaeon]